MILFIVLFHQVKFYILGAKLELIHDQDIFLMHQSNTMKKLLLLSILQWVIFLPINQVLSQTTHVINLRVDTERINLRNPGAACKMSVSSATTVIDSSTTENFTIQVNEDDEIVWQAIATTGEEIDIENVEFEVKSGRRNLTRKAKMNGERQGQRKKKVKAKVRKRTKGNIYKYKITFSVNSSSITIDPKIKVG